MQDTAEGRIVSLHRSMTAWAQGLDEHKAAQLRAILDTPELRRVVAHRLAQIIEHGFCHTQSAFGTEGAQQAYLLGG